MRTLIALTVLMLALASAVWWKTTGGGKPGDVPPTSSEETNEGILTIAPESETDPSPGSLDGSASNASGTSGEPKEASMTGGEEEKTPVDESGSEETEPPLSSELIHIVKDGETLYRIVLNAYGTAPAELVEAVATANQLQSSGSIDKGQTLKLPVIEGFPAPSAG